MNVCRTSSIYKTRGAAELHFCKGKITEYLLKYKRKYGIFSRKPSILEKYAEFMQNRHSFIVKTAMTARFSRQ